LPQSSLWAEKVSLVVLTNNTNSKFSFLVYKFEGDVEDIFSVETTAI